MNISYIKIRNGIPSDFENIQSVIIDWWNGRDLRSNAQRIFFDHFSNTIFIAEYNNELVGFLIGFLSQSRPFEAYIHLVGVRPDMRKNGLGRLLYRRFIEFCSDQGRFIFRSCTSILNKESIEFHKCIGFSIEPGNGKIDGIPVLYGSNKDHPPTVLFMKEIKTKS
jgi:GNAT superfamily N-acetyltransferase